MFLLFDLSLSLPPLPPPSPMNDSLFRKWRKKKLIFIISFENIISLQIGQWPDSIDFVFYADAAVDRQWTLSLTCSLYLMIRPKKIRCPAHFFFFGPTHENNALWMSWIRYEVTHMPCQFIKIRCMFRLKHGCGRDSYWRKKKISKICWKCWEFLSPIISYAIVTQPIFFFQVTTTQKKKNTQMWERRRGRERKKRKKNMISKYVRTT